MWRRGGFCASQLAGSDLTRAWAIFSVAHMALLLADQGEAERAVELYALASRYPYVGHSRYWEHLAGRRIAAVAATLPPEVVAAAEARGRARDLAATVTQLLAELRETWRLLQTLSRRPDRSPEQ